eukprot:821029-Prorocentrum_minimum.AAC.1
MCPREEGGEGGAEGVQGVPVVTWPACGHVLREACVWRHWARPSHPDRLTCPRCGSEVEDECAGAEANLSEGELPTPDSRLPALGGRLPTPDSRSPTPD